MPITKLAPDEKVKYYKGSKYNYKNTIAKSTIHAYNCKNNRGRDRTCTARIKEYILKNNFIKEIGKHSPKYYCSTNKTDTAVDGKQEIIKLNSKFLIKHVA